MGIPKSEHNDFIELIDEFAEDIDFFAEVVLGLRMTPKQIEFCEAFRNNKRITFKGGVGFGKTFSLAVLTWWALITHTEVKVTIFGPGETQIKNGIWNEIHKLWENMDERFKTSYELQATKVERKSAPSSCRAVFQPVSKENVENARGIHILNNFVIVDEATGVDDQVFEVLKGVLRDDNGKLCLVSNPTATNGFFWKTWNDPYISPRWVKVHGQLRDKRNFTEQDLQDAIADYGGEHTREYRMMVLGDFPLEDTDGLISRAIVERAAENTEAQAHNNVSLVWGLDPASRGGDRSVLIQRRGNYVLDDIGVWRNLDPVQLAYKIHDKYLSLAKGERPIVIAVDAIGIGDGVYAALKDFGLPVQAIVVSNSPTKKPHFFFRLRDQLWWECREWLLKGNVRIPNHNDLKNELCAPNYDDTGGQIKVESKKELKKRLKASPDFADALCLTFAINEYRYTGTGSWSKAIEYGDLSWLE